MLTAIQVKELVYCLAGCIVCARSDEMKQSRLLVKDSS